VAGALTTVVIWFLNKFLGIQTPPEVVGALTVVFTFLASYVTPPADGEVVAGPKKHFKTKAA
jgi:hypothetical protein